jgi:hypothetical protein
MERYTYAWFAGKLDRLRITRETPRLYIVLGGWFGTATSQIKKDEALLSEADAVAFRITEIDRTKQQLRDKLSRLEQERQQLEQGKVPHGYGWDE